jgi:hypothetical protein
LTHGRRPVLLALGFGLLHALIALGLARWPLAYGDVGEQAMADDVHIYFDYATKILGGAVPYHDIQIEYPPLALVAFLLPRLATAGFPAYRLLFAAQLLAADVLALVLLARLVARQDGLSAAVRRLGWYTLTLAVLCPMAVCRFDLLVASWAFAAALAWSSGRPAVGGVLAGAGVHLKVVPGVIAVSGLAATSGRARAGGLFGFVATLAVGFVVLGMLGGRNVVSSLAYHLDRGVEIGSLYAGLMMAAAKLLAAPLSYAYANHANEVATPWSWLAGRLAFPVQAAAVLLVGWRAARDRELTEDPFRYHAAAVLGFVAFGKVLSPQYTLWPIPLLAALRGRRGGRARALFLAACVLTTWIYPWAFNGLTDFDAWPVVLLNARNLLLVALWADLTFDLVPARTTGPLAA